MTDLLRRTSPAILAVLALVGSLATGVRAADSPRLDMLRPNILLIVADDLGWGDVGWHGGFARTPHMDRLVAAGVELDRHYVQPVCTPTRTALLSGRYPGRFGPQALVPSNLRAMDPGTPTLASALRSAGYATFQVGKWHLGSRPEWGPTAFGFDHAYGTLAGAADPWTHAYRRGPYEQTWHRDGRPIREQGNATELVAAEALRRIRAAAADDPRDRRPWFLYVAFHAVHTPVDAPEEYKRPYAGIRFDDDPLRHDSRLRLAAMASQLDAAIGAFVEALEATRQLRDTLVVFTSDNGGKERSNNPYVSTVPSSPLNSENAPLRGEKDQLYDGGIRVCAFAHWPGVLAPRRCTLPMHAVDWFPTLAGLAGYRPQSDVGWDGVDRWQAIAGFSAEPREKPIYVATGRGAALLDGDWKLIQTDQNPPLLFDLATDPGEQRDIAGAHPERVAQLRALLDREAARDRTDMPTDLAGMPP